MNKDLEQIKAWRLQALECRAVADQVQLAATREAFMRIADTYEQLANNLEASLGHRDWWKPKTG